MHLTGSMIMNVKKDAFLSNKKNKQSFINLLSRTLEQNGRHTKHATGDADVLIVQTTIQYAQTANTVLAGDDTDLLILLCHHAPMDSSKGIYCRPEAKTGTEKLPYCWIIKLTKEALGAHVCQNILFVHALLGCDTTSRVFGIGKGVALKQLKNNAIFCVHAEVLNKRGATAEEIAMAGESALVSLYSGSQTGDTLDQLRLQKFCQKVGTSTASVQPQILPPTSAAARYHSFSVYRQVQTWQSSDLPPTDWGWKMSGCNLIPIMTDMDVAPKALLEVIKCSCKTGCSTMRCSCRKADLNCSRACGECRGLCTNKSAIEQDDSSTED